MADGYVLSVRSENGRYLDEPRIIRIAEPPRPGFDGTTWSDVEAAFRELRGCTVHVLNEFNGSTGVWEITPEPFVFNFGRVL